MRLHPSVDRGEPIERVGVVVADGGGGRVEHQPGRVTPERPEQGGRRPVGGLVQGLGTGLATTGAPGDEVAVHQGTAGGPISPPVHLGEVAPHEHGVARLGVGLDEGGERFGVREGAERVGREGEGHGQRGRHGHPGQGEPRHAPAQVGEAGGHQHHRRGQHLEPVVAEEPEPGQHRRAPGRHPQPQVQVGRPARPVPDPVPPGQEPGRHQGEVEDHEDGDGGREPAQRGAHLHLRQHVAAGLGERPRPELVEGHQQPSGRHRGRQRRHEGADAGQPGGDRPSPGATSSQPGGGHPGHHTGDPRLAAQHRHPERHPGHRAGRHRAPSGPHHRNGPGEQGEVGVVGGLGVDREERHRTPHRHQRGPPPGPGAVAPPRVQPQHQGGTGQSERRHQVERSQVGGAGETERRLEQERWQRRLAVDGVHVERAALAQRDRLRGDGRLVGIEQLVHVTGRADGQGQHHHHEHERPGGAQCVTDRGGAGHGRPRLPATPWAGPAPGRCGRATVSPGRAP